MNKTILTAVIALVIGAGLGYFGGTAFAHPATAQGGAGNFARAGGGANFTGARGGAASATGGFITGTVASKDSESITVDTRDGSSHVVLVTPGTQVAKSVSGTADDLTVGSNVMVSGSTNSDGSVSAQTIQLRPAGSANAPMIPASPTPQ